MHSIVPALALALLHSTAIDAPSPRFVTSPAAAETTATAQASDKQALAGEWIYVEDRTPELAAERRRPNQGGRFTITLDAGFAVLERSSGAGRHAARFPLDGSNHEQRDGQTLSSYTGRWENGALHVDARADAPGKDGRVVTESKLTFTPTAEGLVTRWQILSPVQVDSTCLYKHAEDIALPAPASAKIVDVAWIAGAWVGAAGKSSTEERWSPPGGGALLGVSRTVSGERMVAFEFLRIVERDGGLVYVAQPGGAPPTEFALVERSDTQAVFMNPRHDFPQRIVYELSADGAKLTASIGYVSGGRPQRFEFERERD